MANLCAPFPVTVPPCPCHRPLPAASWTTARWQHIQASQSVGSGEREGGRRRRRRLGKGGDPVVFQEGRGNSSQLSPSPRYRHTHFPGAEATFLHLGQAKARASAWDCRQGQGPGILSFSFRLSPFLPLWLSSPLPPPLLPPADRGVSAESWGARGPRPEDCGMEIRRGLAGPSPPSEILRQRPPRLGMWEGRGAGACGGGELRL